jgi:hypothetical protein
LLVPRAKAEATTTHYYGLPMAAMDAASIGLFLGGAAGNDGGLVGLSAVSFSFGPPLVHLLHGHPKRALASLGIRTLAGGLAVGAIVWDLTANYCDPDGGHCDGPVLGLTVGAMAILAAMVVDDAVLARDTVPAQPSVIHSLVPAVGIGQRAALLSLGGRF